MKTISLLICFSLLAGMGFCQPTNDSVWQRLKAKANSIKKNSRDSIGAPKSLVVITSGSQAAAKRDNSTWENRWQNHIDLQSVKIAEKVLMRDPNKMTYQLKVEFSINEDGTLKDLIITCHPASPFVENECRKMVLAAPKKTPVYKNGKYIRPHITQPIEIRVK
jgi:hypothetical protein